MPKQYVTYQRIIGYLKDLLSNRQRHDLEKDVMRDVFDEEAFDGLSLMSPGEVESDMESLDAWLDKRTKQTAKRVIPLYFRIAASVILIIGLGSILYLTIFSKPGESEPGYIAEKNEIVQPEEKTTDKTITGQEDLTLNQTPESDELSVLTEERSGSENIRQNQEQMLPLKVSEEVSSAAESDVITNDRITGDAEPFEKKSAPEVRMADAEDLASVSASAQMNSPLQSFAVRIVDQSGQPVSGVTVYKKGIVKGVETDLDGTFSLEMAEPPSAFSINTVYFREMEWTGSEEPVAGTEEIYDALALKELVILDSPTDSKRAVFSEATNRQPGLSEYSDLIPTIELTNPVPPGGTLRAYKRMVENNLDTQKLLTEIEKLDELTGRYRIDVTMTVFKDGSVGNIRIADAIPQVVSEEYMQSIEGITLWQPAMQGSMPIESEVEMRFSLSIE